MARTTFPTTFLAEFRGWEPGRSFVAKDSGELVELPPVLKVERDVTDPETGCLDVQPIALRVRDDVSTDFDPKQLKRGDQLLVSAEVAASRDSGLYLQLQSVTRDGAKAAAKLAPVAQAS